MVRIANHDGNIFSVWWISRFKQIFVKTRPVKKREWIFSQKILPLLGSGRRFWDRSIPYITLILLDHGSMQVTVKPKLLTIKSLLKNSTALPKHQQLRCKDLTMSLSSLCLPHFWNSVIHIMKSVYDRSDSICLVLVTISAFWLAKILMGN